MLIQKIKKLCVRYGHALQVIWWFFRRPTTQGAKCLVLFNDKMLLVRPSYSHRRWTIPGGQVKKNESFSDAATRELLEETGVAVSDLKFFYKYKQVIEYKNDTVECFYAFASNDVVKIDNAEIVEYGWFLQEDLPNDISPSVIKIAQEFKALNI
jgi:ADP-ribose pyrophosphatase YjhB (NUDIX family)